VETIVIKQNLKIKTFVGTSANALLTQIWTALIAILVLKEPVQKPDFIGAAAPVSNYFGQQ
jgi:hypothetical protein